MTAMFPDSGVPASDARNSLTNPSTANCNPLWYSTSRCQPRFDPAAANAVLSELLNLINSGEVVYDCNFLNQVQLAVRYLIQRGLPHGGMMSGGPANYTMALDPPLTRYNNFLTLTVVPAVNDISGGNTLNIDGHGNVPILRSDGQNLKAGDLLANIPYIISYVNGAFYLCGLAASQVPIIVTGALDFWIRPDGNDTTGDGTANTPEKAFKTIAGCWDAVGSRFAATPSFQVRMRLGVPASYEGAVIDGFAGNVSITGDINNPTGYIITPILEDSLNHRWTCFRLNNMGTFWVIGLTLVQTVPPATGSCSMVRVITSNVGFSYCRVEINVSNPNTSILELVIGTFSMSWDVSLPIQTFYVVGNGHDVGYFITADSASTFQGVSGGFPGAQIFYDFSDVKFINSAVALANLSTGKFNINGITDTGCTGYKWNISQNSILNMNGLTLPGTLPGVTSTGAQYIA